MPGCPGELGERGTTMPSGRRKTCGSLLRATCMEPHGAAYNGIRRRGRRAQEEEQVAAPNTAITYILPDEGWAPLLEIIVREAPTASVIVTAAARPR